MSVQRITQIMESGTTLSAGELHLGEVGGNTKSIIVYPTITAGAYSANDIIGGKLEIPNAGRVSGKGGILQSITVIDKGKKAVELGFYLFSSLAGTYADNDAEAISAADALLTVGHVIVAVSDYKTLANFSLATITNIGLPYVPTTTSLWFIVRTPAGVTYLTANDLQFVFGVLRD